MPNPKEYKDDEKQKFMEDCMHQVMHVEKKDRDQSIAQCLSMWGSKDSKKKKCASELIRELSHKLMSL